MLIMLVVKVLALLTVVLLTIYTHHQFSNTQTFGANHA
jgi:uncharacterized membrane protein